ncbi:hypothetical protein FE257_011984 [Aspergillus nanangensis]|uniref:DUF7703 domain-containing protein n=1 Tax=Aspergillus nanangensis TaxID=2582783 RepID=A0AAD4CGR1_ASPNN|nr:hypothetical protein FE257_011984 [Aspergillus nanangensis]
MDDGSAPVEGIASPYKGDNLAIKGVIIAFTTLAIYSALELIVIILSSFKIYRGLYFWSLFLSAGLGVIPDAIGLILKYFTLAPLRFAAILSTVGCTRILRFVLYMIITNAIIIGGPQWVMTLGTLFSTIPTFFALFNIWEKVQLSVFFVQEVIISSIFIVGAVRLLQLYPLRSQHRSALMYQLLCINVIIIVMDIAIIVLEFQQFFMVQTALKTFFYATKLKLEVAVLSKLAAFVSYNHINTIPTSIQ